MKCMKNEKKKRFRTLSKRLRLGLGRNLEGKRVFWWKGKVWIEREEREIKMFKFEMNRVKPQIYIEIRSLIDWEGIENKNLIDWEVSRRYRWQKILDRLRRYRTSIEQTKTLKNWIDGSSYLSRGVENKPRNIDRKDLCRGAIEFLSRRYRASIKKLEAKFFKEEKQHKMNAIKIDIKTSNQEVC